MGRKSKFDNEKFKQQVIDLFEGGKSSDYISKQLVIPKTTLIRNLDKLGYNFDRNHSSSRYNLNQSYFEKIDSEVKAYWLGLIYADGSNKVNRSTFVLGLKEDDKAILELLKKDLEYNNSIKVYKDNRGNRKDFYTLNVYSKKICEDLEAHGVTQNKTYTLQAPSISEEFYSHFLRGYFDGDGSISTTTTETNHRKDAITFTGTSEVVSFVKSICNKLDINSNIYERHPERDNNNFTLVISGRLNVIKLCEFMYDNNNGRFLKRKFNRFQKIKNRYD